MKWKTQRSTINTAPKGVKQTRLIGFEHVINKHQMQYLLKLHVISVSNAEKKQTANP